MPDDSKEVVLILTLMDKAVRQNTLYGHEHPQSQGAMRDFELRLRDGFPKFQNLSLDVKRTEFEWNGEVVLHIAKRENNYIQQMYVDGVRQLEILPSVSSDELRGLISVLGRDIHGYEVREDDTVTLLWKKGFENIRYQTVDIYSGDRFALLQEINTDEEENKAQAEEQDYLRGFVARLIEGGRSIADSPATPNEFESAVAQPLPNEAFRVDEASLDALRAECEKLQGRDYLSDILTVYCEVLELRSEAETFPRLVDSFLTVIRTQLQEGQVAQAADWLRKLRGVDAHVSHSSVDAHQTIEAALLNMATPELFRTLGQKIASGLSVPTEQWIQFFTYLGSRSAPAICEMLAHFPQETLHSALCEFLISHAPESTDVYGSFLNRAEWMVVRDMVRVLGALGDDRLLLSDFRKAGLNSHPEVRREFVRCLKRFNTKPAYEFLVRAFQDPDEHVRTTAIQIAGNWANSYFAKPLASIVSKEQFTDRPFLEKRRTLVALARCAGSSALEFLTQVTEASGASDAADELRLAALYAIAAIGDEKSRSFLQELAQRRFAGRNLKDAAARLLAGTKEEEDPNVD